MSSATTGPTRRMVVLAARPKGMPIPADFALRDEPLDDPGPGQVEVDVDVLSIDAFIRTVMEERSYHRPLKMGDTLTAIGVGRVRRSTVAAFAPGDTVFGPLGAQTIATVPAAALRMLDVTEVPATTYLGALGVTTGLTAYFGVVDVGSVQPGDTVVVSGAAGAVGSLAGQIARIAGAARVIGIAGGPAKVAFLTDELGFDAGIDYKREDVSDRIGALAPDGIDVFFDNVGGEILDAALLHLRERARVVICGGISNYLDMDHVSGPRNYLKLAERHARMEGFAVTHFAERFSEAEAALRAWLRDGSLIVREHYEYGIDRFPEALRMLLSGGHMGKLLLDLRLR